eukprot:1991008-Rhodomonas_salina.3
MMRMAMWDEIQHIECQFKTIQQKPARILPRHLEIQHEPDRIWRFRLILYRLGGGLKRGLGRGAADREGGPREEDDGNRSPGANLSLRSHP